MWPAGIAHSGESHPELRGHSKAMFPLAPAVRDLGAMRGCAPSHARGHFLLLCGGWNSYAPAVNLQSLAGFPVARPRRLRQSPALRRLVAETRLNVDQLVLPLFARSGTKLRRPVDAMPGVFQLSPDEIVREAAAAHALGVPAVLLFGIPDQKDAEATGAYAERGLCRRRCDCSNRSCRRCW